MLSTELPPAHEALGLLREHLHDGDLVVVLDYDGTLTPIVERPEHAELDHDVRDVLRELSARVPVVLLSGRGLDDLRARVGIAEAVYAGCHGFEIEGPGLHFVHPEAERLEKAVAEVAETLEGALAGVEGALIERKRYAVAVHYRMVDASDRERVEAALDEALAGRPRLARRSGKMVFEILPDTPWNKGRALLWVLVALGRERGFPLFFGDDRTDEDAFAAIGERGLSVVVSHEARPTAARMRVSNPDEVQALLASVARES